MLILFLAYLLLCVFGVKFQFKNKADYLSVENTQAIKGIFILMVFFSHFNSYITLKENTFNTVYQVLFSIIGQSMVAPFLFYSGYGVMESVKQKGMTYILKMPKNRILTTLFNFDLAIVLFYVLSLILGEEVALKQLLLSFIGWDSIGNSNWYIFVILILYLLTYVVFMLTEKRSFCLTLSLMMLFVCVLIFLSAYTQIKPSFWYDTMLCYVFGMGYSVYKENIEKILCRNMLIWASTIILLIVLYLIFINCGIVGEIVANLIFVATVIIFTMHITLKNRILVWCGKNLFELYILQRIPMITFKQLSVEKTSIGLYFVLCIVCTAVLAIGFKYLSKKLWESINGPKDVLKK